MRLSSTGLLAAAGLALFACETYKADARPGSDDRAAVPEDQAGGDTAPAATKASAPASATPTAANEPTCDDVVAHLIALTQKELDKLSEAERQQAAAVLPSVKAQVADACSASKWSAPFKQCILGANSEAELVACEKFGPDSKGAPAAAPPATEKAQPAAAADSGPACAEVIDHVIEVALSAPDIPETQREQMKAVMPQQKGLMLKACNSTPWPPALRKCLREAKTGNDIQGCRSFATQ